MLSSHIEGTQSGLDDLYRYEAGRLIRFLDCFLPVMDTDVIPSISIIREFIGNSTFNY